MDISNKRFAIATHYLVYGASQALREYLMKGAVGELTYISHPLKADSSRSFSERIRDGKVVRKKTSPIRFRFCVPNYFAEFFLSFFWMMRTPGKHDIMVGVDPLNCALAVLLKKLGKVRYAIYYTIDYVPVRFESKLLNRAYHWVDSFCVRHVDEVWNVSSRIALGREEFDGILQDRHLQKVVPIGIWFDKVRRLPFEKIKKHQLFFMGNLLEKQGVQLVIDAIPAIKEKVPDFHFFVVGGGEYEEALHQKVASMGLGEDVTFTGWIKERERIDQIMADSAIALALYDGEKDNFTWYADPTKLKDYLSAGLPIILTDVPHNAQEIAQRECGLIVGYDARELADAVVALLQDEGKLRQWRQNAVDYVRQYEWTKVFEEALRTHEKAS